MTNELPKRPPPAPPAELFERVKGAVAQATPGPRAPYGVRLAMGFCVAVATITVVSLFSQRDFRALPFERLLVVTGEVALLAILAVTIATARGRDGLGASIGILALIALAVTPLYALATALTPLHPIVVDLTPPTLSYSLRTGFMCTAFGSAIGGIVLAAFAYSMRRGVPAGSVMRGAALGAAAGTAAGLALHLFCPHYDRAHILVGHVLPIAIFVVVGMLVTPRLLRP